MKVFNLKLILLTMLLMSFYQIPQALALSSSEHFENFKEEIVVTDNPLKTWTITASKSFDAKTITNESVFILDEQGNPVTLKEITVERNKILVSPSTPYLFDHTYTLYLKGTIQSTKGATLAPKKFQFVVEKPPTDTQPKIALTANLYAQVSNPDFKKFSLNLLVNGQIVGGYETAAGKTILEQTIDVSTNTNSIERKYVDDKRYYFLYDVTTSKLRAVYWELESASKYFEEWNQSATFERSIDASELYVLLTNEFRVKENKLAVAFDESLTRAAFEHSKDMGTNNYFSHTSFDGRSLGDRVWPLCSSCSAIGENIAANQLNVFLAHHGWINSSGHRRNLLNESYSHVGFGIYYSNTADYNRFYTTNFGQIR